MAGLGLTITLIDLFLRTSRIQDIFLNGLHVPLVVMLCGFGMLVVSARLFNFLLSPYGRSMALFTTLCLLAIGVSIWPGGAYDHLMSGWIPVLPAFVMICAFVRTYEQLRRVMAVVASGFAFVMYVATFRRSSVGVDRSGISDFTFGDANELALIALFYLPIAVWVILNKRTKTWIKLYLGGSILLAVPVFFRTGSRAGLVAMVVAGMYILYRQSNVVRVRVILAVCIAIPVGLAFAPPAVIDRYATLLPVMGGRRDPLADPATSAEDRANEGAVASAVASRDTRWRLFKRSLVVTLQNPLLGVGPGMFTVAENEMAIEAGQRRGSWHSTHNMFTEVSTGMGIPALIVFLVMLARCWRTLGRAEKASPRGMSFAPELRKLSSALKVSMVVFLTGGLTLTIALSIYLPLFCGLCVVIERLLAAGFASALHAEAESEAEGAERLAADPEPVAARTMLPSPRPQTSS